MNRNNELQDTLLDKGNSTSGRSHETVDVKWLRYINPNLVTCSIPTMSIPRKATKDYKDSVVTKV